jgi:hypothetical protein
LHSLLLRKDLSVLSSRVSFALAVILLLIAAALRMWDLTQLPPGLHPQEISDIRIAEAVRQGRIEVFYNLGGEGREGLYDTLLAVTTSIIGKGTLGYHLPSVWLGMLTLALVYVIALRFFGTLAAVASMALLALGMLPVLLSREVAREASVPLLVSMLLITLALALPVYRKRRIDTTVFAALGVLLGLGVYLHPIGLLTALLSMIFIAYMVLSRQPLSRQRIGFINFAILIMIIIAMPYLISAVRNPELAGPARLFVNGQSFSGIVKAITGGLAGVVFMGDANPAQNLPGRPMIDLVSGVFVVIGIVTAARYWRQPRFALMLIATFTLLPPALLSANSPNFLAYAGILPLIALYFGLGICTLLNGLTGRALQGAYVGLVALLLFNVVWTTRDLFAVWKDLPAVKQAYNSRLGELAHYLDLTSINTPTVVCAKSLNQPMTQPDLSGAELLALMMNRQDAPIRYSDCNQGLVFTNGGEREQVILPEPDALQQMHPYLTHWLAQGTLSSDPNVPTGSVVMLNVAKPLADTIGRFTTTAPAGYAPEVGGSLKPVAPPVSFTGNLTFLGYEKHDPERYKPGDTVPVITYWRADGVVPPDLRLFTHVLFDPASITAQTDLISVDPSKLQNRDVFVQVTYVPLPSSTPDGTYYVSVGAYQASTEEKARLLVLDNGQPRGNRLFLYPITVAGGS